MRQLDFEQLCRDASLALGIDDTGALGQGFTVQFEDTLFETAFREGRDSCLLMAELCVVEPEKKLAVYKNLLTMQLLAWHMPAMCFGFNPTRQTVVLCIDCALGPQSSGAWLAMVIRGAAMTAAGWRKTLLVADASLPNDADAKREAAMDELLARQG